ncbi:hypothetical protein HK104_005366 [Borealophlyctis nickersoniae]|nr:hypothetical protein HK104_005366 [Borealophlyctis nickersoniae]
MSGITLQPTSSQPTSITPTKPSGNHDPASWWEYLEAQRKRGVVGRKLRDLFKEATTRLDARNNPTVLDIWLEYLTLQRQLGEDHGAIRDLYKKLKSRVDKLAKFWIAWAEFERSAGSVDKAKNAIRLGISARAQPVEELDSVLAALNSNPENPVSIGQKASSTHKASPTDSMKSQSKSFTESDEDNGSDDMSLDEDITALPASVSSSDSPPLSHKSMHELSDNQKGGGRTNDDLLKRQSFPGVKTGQSKQWKSFARPKLAGLGPPSRVPVVPEAQTLDDIASPPTVVHVPPAKSRVTEYGMQSTPTVMHVPGAHSKRSEYRVQSTPTIMHASIGLRQPVAYGVHNTPTVTQSTPTIMHASIGLRQPVAYGVHNTPTVTQSTPNVLPASVGMNWATQAQNFDLKEKSHIVVNSITYRRLGRIGSGGSSKVYKIISDAGETFALKKVKLRGIDPIAMEGYMNEIALLRRLEKNERIIRLLDSEENLEAGYLKLVLEYGEIDLSNLLKKEQGKPLSVNFIRMYWEQAVHAIHEENIIHSDLKPANFLLVKGSLKLIDFGIAKSIPNDTTNIQRDHQTGTLNYMAPEAIIFVEKSAAGNRRQYLKLGRSSDVWSLGCILYQMAYGRPPFGDLPMMKKIQCIVDQSYMIDFPPTMDPALVGAMRSCLDRDRTKRMGIPNLLAHEFLHPEGVAKPASAGMTLPLAESIVQEVMSIQNALVKDVAREMYLQLTSGKALDLSQFR